MSRPTLKEVKEAIQFTVECEPEPLPIDGNCMASGDDDYDREVGNKIRSELENGNEWAWCCIKVTAEYRGITGSDYLGGCSYASEEDFTSSCGYYEDMKTEATDRLLDTLRDVQFIE